MMRQSGTKKAKKHSIVSAIIKFAVLCLAVYIAFVLVTQQIELSEKKRTLSKLTEQRDALLISNQEKKQLIEKSGEDEFVEQIARDYYNFAYPEEHIFLDISGS